RGLERLIFLRNSLVVSSPLNLNQLILKNLTHLEVEFSYDPSLVENERFKELTTIFTPALTHLSLHMRVSLCSHEEALEFYYSLFSTIVSKKAYLKSLSDLRREISEVQLDELRFSFCLHESVPPFDLGSKLLTNQKNLKTIEVSLLNGCTHLYPLIKEAIETNAKTLTSLSVQNGSYPGKNLKAEILSSVSSCQHLEFLQFSGFKMNSLREAFRRNSYSLKNLELAGTMSPGILLEITVLKNLEQLKFWYNMSVDVSHYQELEINLKEVIRMPRLREIKLLVGGLSLDFLLDEPGIEIRGNRNGLHECTLIISKTENSISME
ncbi:unnamed protein product, partial [Allacma fusca]